MHYDPHVKDMIDERVAGGYRTHGSSSSLNEGSDDIYDHRAAWEAFEGLLSSGLPATYSAEGRSLLLLGSEGTGKTHLLHAFRRHVHYRELGAYALLKLSSCVDSTGRVLLGEVIDSLQEPYRESSSPESTLLRISNALVADPSLVDPELIARFRSESDEDDSRRLAHRISNKLYLNSERFHEIDPDLLKALLYLQKDDPLVQHLVSRYLRCEVLGNLDRRALGDIVSRTDDGDPKGMVEHLCRVTWALLGGPLVIGVDQDEPDIHREVLRRGLRFVSDILDRLSTSVVVVGCRSETWREHQSFLPRLVVRRLENDPVPVSVRVRKRDDQVLDLVKDRMQLLNDAFRRRMDRSDESDLTANGSAADGFDGSSIRHLFPEKEAEDDTKGEAPESGNGALIRASDVDVESPSMELAEFNAPALQAPEEESTSSADFDLSTQSDLETGADENTSSTPEFELFCETATKVNPPGDIAKATDETPESLSEVSFEAMDLSAESEASTSTDADVTEGEVTEDAAFLAPERASESSETNVELVATVAEPEISSESPKSVENAFDSILADVIANSDSEVDTDAWMNEEHGPGALVIEPTSSVAPETMVSLEDLFLDPMLEDSTAPRTECAEAVTRIQEQWEAFLNRRRPRAPVSVSGRLDLISWAIHAAGAELPRPMRIAVKKCEQGLDVTVENRTDTTQLLVCLCEDESSDGALTQRVRKIASMANGHAVTLLRSGEFPTGRAKGAAVVRRKLAAGWRTDVIDEAALQDLRAVRGFVEAHADDPALPRWRMSERPVLGARFLAELLRDSIPVEARSSVTDGDLPEPTQESEATERVGPLEALALSSARADAVVAAMDAPEVRVQEPKLTADLVVDEIKNSEPKSTEATEAIAASTEAEPAAAPKNVQAETTPAEKAVAKKAPAKKVVAKTAPAKKVVAKKAPAKKAPAKKVVAKTVPAKKTVAKAPAKKAPAKKAPAKKVVAKKAPAKKVVAKKALAKKAPAKKVISKTLAKKAVAKAVAKKAVAKAPAKKAVAKAPVKKAVAKAPVKKAVAKAPAKKAAAKRAPSKKAQSAAKAASPRRKAASSSARNRKASVMSQSA